MTSVLPHDRAPGRALLGTGLVLFVVSTGFPIVASALETPPARWLGLADVAVALALVGTGLAISSRRPATLAPPVLARVLRVHESLSHMALALLLVFLVAGDRIHWDVLLAGLAWRVWLLMLVLPSWIAWWTPELQRRVDTVGERHTT